MYFMFSMQFLFAFSHRNLLIRCYHEDTCYIQHDNAHSLTSPRRRNFLRYSSLQKG